MRYSKVLDGPKTGLFDVPLILQKRLNRRQQNCCYTAHEEQQDLLVVMLVLWVNSAVL
jgi:hypothetical protein